MSFRRRRGYYKASPYNRYNNKLVSRALKSIREANKSNSSIDFAFKVNYVFTAFYDSNSERGVAAINTYDVLFRSENFQNMMKNWDQVKLNGVTCRLNVTDALVSLGEVANVKSINVITGWDKTGLSVNDVEFYDNLNIANGNLIDKDDFDSTSAKAYLNKVGPRVGQGYGAKKGLLNSYQRFSRYESCWPSTIEEKGCYIPTSTFSNYSGDIDSNTGVTEISGEYSDQNVNTQLAQPNPCIPFENNSIKWKPTLLVGVFSTTVGRNAQPDIVNPQWVQWNNNNPTVEQLANINRDTTPDATNPPTDASRLVNYNKLKSLVKSPYQSDLLFIQYYNALTQAAGLNPDTPNENVTIGTGTKTTKAWLDEMIGAVNNNTTAWQIANNPAKQMIPNPNQGLATTKVTQYGDVTPVVFNGEFTIPVTFKGQKGDM